MDAALASCSSSLALTLRRPLHYDVARVRGVSFGIREISSVYRTGCKWVLGSASSSRKVLKASATGSEGTTKKRGRKPYTKSSQPTAETNGVLAGDVDVNNDVGAPPVQPKKKRGGHKKVTLVEDSSTRQTNLEKGEEEEEEWDFWGELAENIARSREGQTVLDKAQLGTTDIIEAEAMKTAIGDLKESSSPTSGSKQWNEEKSRVENTSGHRNEDNDEIDFEDANYNTKPDWMPDAAWQSLNQQDDDEEQPLWVEEEDPTWPEEGEDGWGFRTSQFFDKVSIKPDKSDGDGGDDDEELNLNWESEADDWIIKEITSNEWELHVFGDPSPLVVYVFARYGRSNTDHKISYYTGMDSWKTLKEFEKAVLSIWESRKAPLRAIKVDVGMEIDLGSALKIGKDDFPQILFIKNGKGLYRLEGARTSEELLQLTAHLFYNGTRPSFLDTSATPETLESLA